jgi:DNA-binding response OmpR family regulator
MAIIDSDRAGYEALAGSGRARLRFLASGREALRLAATENISVWWIGVELSDMSGFDLYDMLRQQLEDATVCMVGPSYRIEDDLLARRAGAAMYVCKPVERCWLPASVGQACAGSIESPRREAAVQIPQAIEERMVRAVW